MEPKEENRVNHPDDLHKVLGLGNLKFIGYIDEQCAKNRELERQINGQSLGDSVASTPAEISLTPQLITSPMVRDAFKHNDWKTIQKLSDQADADLKPMIDQCINKPFKAWVLVMDQNTGLDYHISYSSNGSYLWTFCPYVDSATDPNNPNVKYSCTAQVGSYSKTTGIAGVHSYLLKLVKITAGATISALIAYFVNRLLKKGIDFLASDLSIFLTDAATDAGITALFTIGTYVLPIFVPCAIFAIVFIGIHLLWEWLNKHFTICVYVNNWDTDHDWYIRDQALSNAVNPGKNNNNSLNIKIPKLIPPGTNPFSKIWVPSDISSQLMHTTDDEVVVSYVYLVYQNSSTFAQGCSFAFALECESTNSGMTYAFQCPWVDSNAHYMEDSVQNANSFLSKARAHWVESTSTYQVTASNGKLIEATIDALTGGDGQGSDNYKIIINLANN
ncbi:hypothetical protein CYY_006247 [Polysphondylium violaceum]|uniref:Uncharacterized protein n=1 Tax=Polysphondylium violaceum TaxID=133409 RepID=A0A8J4UYA9_9MYCE|nr:hypothetical protein CYY_006247 [Polysphondylium violaceum]